MSTEQEQATPTPTGPGWYWFKWEGWPGHSWQIVEVRAEPGLTMMPPIPLFAHVDGAELPVLRIRADWRGPLASPARTRFKHICAVVNGETNVSQAERDVLQSRAFQEAGIDEQIGKYDLLAAHGLTEPPPVSESATSQAAMIRSVTGAVTHAMITIRQPGTYAIEVSQRGAVTATRMDTGGTAVAQTSADGERPGPPTAADQPPVGPRCWGSWADGNNCKVCWRCLETAPKVARVSDEADKGQFLIMQQAGPPVKRP